MAARSVYRTLQSAEDICDAQRVLGVIVKIADDPGNIRYSYCQKISLCIRVCM